MEKYAITPGDFLKNAGIVGMKYILDCAKAQEGVDFGISEDGQEMWLNCESKCGLDQSVFPGMCAKFWKVYCLPGRNGENQVLYRENSE